MSEGRASRSGSPRSIVSIAFACTSGPAMPRPPSRGVRCTSALPRAVTPITTILSRNVPGATRPSRTSRADTRRTVPGGPRKSIHVVCSLWPPARASRCGRVGRRRPCRAPPRARSAAAKANVGTSLIRWRCSRIRLPSCREQVDLVVRRADCARPCPPAGRRSRFRPASVPRRGRPGELGVRHRLTLPPGLAVRVRSSAGTAARGGRASRASPQQRPVARGCSARRPEDHVDCDHRRRGPGAAGPAAGRTAARGIASARASAVAEPRERLVVHRDRRRDGGRRRACPHGEPGVHRAQLEPLHRCGIPHVERERDADGHERDHGGGQTPVAHLEPARPLARLRERGAPSAPRRGVAASRGSQARGRRGRSRGGRRRRGSDEGTGRRMRSRSRCSSAGSSGPAAASENSRSSSELSAIFLPPDVTRKRKAAAAASRWSAGSSAITSSRCPWTIVSAPPRRRSVSSRSRCDPAAISSSHSRFMTSCR